MCLLFFFLFQFFVSHYIPLYLPPSLSLSRVFSECFKHEFLRGPAVPRRHYYYKSETSAAATAPKDLPPTGGTLRLQRSHTPTTGCMFYITHTHTWPCTNKYLFYYIINRINYQSYFMFCPAYTVDAVFFFFLSSQVSSFFEPYTHALYATATRNSSRRPSPNGRLKNYILSNGVYETRPRFRMDGKKKFICKTKKK